MKTLILSWLLFWVSGPALAEDAAGLIKDQLEFSSWPNKNGSMKKGFKLTIADYPVFSNFDVKEDALLFGDGIVRRSLRLTLNNKEIIIDVIVSKNGNDSAQEAGIRKMGETDAMPSDVYKRADQNGVKIGDISFAGPKLTCFFRNNVFVYIFSNDPNVSTSSLATQMDLKISQMPDLTKAQVASQCPIVARFATGVPTLTAKSQKTILNIDCNDPSQEALTKEVNSNDISIKHDTNPIEIGPNKVPGVKKLTLFVANESLLSSKAETTVTVVPK